MPDLSGRIALITGANSGIGFEAGRQLARKRAHVVLACRDLQKAESAARAIRQETPDASLESIRLDLADLASVRACAEETTSRHSRIDILCNNAGVMALPYRVTADGFEMQIGTNHYGHFALTGLLLEPLLAAPSPRVVTVSSNAHRFTRPRLDDPRGTAGRYHKWLAYAWSKLANLLFAFELQRRADRSGLPLLSMGCHPGYSATNLQAAGPRMAGSSWLESITEFANRTIAQDAATGALPTLYAATAPEARGGDYIGPDGWAEMWGHPKKVSPSRHARDENAAREL